MLATIRHYGVTDSRVVQAIAGVDRQKFVSDEWKQLAYEDRPLAIGFGQTISQPYTVARMVELVIEEVETARLQDAKVLEVGTGSGWQTAVLAQLFGRVYSIELVAELARQAKKTLAGLGCKNVEIVAGNGKQGWREYAPYQAIIVAADANKVPPALVDQLAEGGRLVLPIMGELVRLTKTAGEMHREEFGPYVFVPLI